MAKKRKRGEKWMLLFKVEDFQRVYVYEPLQNHSLKARLRQGWKVIG